MSKLKFLTEKFIWPHSHLILTKQWNFHLVLDFVLREFVVLLLVLRCLGVNVTEEWTLIEVMIFFELELRELKGILAV